MKQAEAVGSALQIDIHRAVARNLGETAATIGVLVDGEVATLTGHVSSLALKWSAEQAARESGASALVNEIKVQLSPEDEVPDEHLARSVLDVLKWDIRLPTEAIQVHVSDGYVALTGTVDWPYQIGAAAAAVSHLAGVRALSNQLEAKPRVSPKEVQSQIRMALERAAAVDASHITVAVKGGVVTLTGYVRSWPEREDAQTAALAIPGIVEVENHVRIANW